MGFINNTSYILNAVLTKKGKEYLSKSSGNFNITKFALADDEIDYGLWNTAHPLGTNHYGAVLESTPMLEPCVDPEVVMKYKLFTMPDGTKALPYISNITPPSLLGDNALKTEYNADGSPQWTFNNHSINPSTIGADGTFSTEKYSFLVLNKNVIDIRPGMIPQDGTFDNLPETGAIYTEETGRLSKKILSRVATIGTQPITASQGSRETSIIITGQMSGAIYVFPVRVNYVDNSP
jgi:hypothetical protein